MKLGYIFNVNQESLQALAQIEAYGKCNTLQKKDVQSHVGIFLNQYVQTKSHLPMLQSTHVQTANKGSEADKISIISQARRDGFFDANYRIDLNIKSLKAYVVQKKWNALLGNLYIKNYKESFYQRNNELWFNNAFFYKNNVTEEQKNKVIAIAREDASKAATEGIVLDKVKLEAWVKNTNACNTVLKDLYIKEYINVFENKKIKDKTYLPSFSTMQKQNNLAPVTECASFAKKNINKFYGS